MCKTISILHLSDIHRNQEGKVDNKALITSLIQDRECYTQSNGIKKPDLIIVSGDIIYGSINIDFDSAIQEIEEQYVEAEKFLDELVDEFLNGDKSRIIIVPGNHDVSFPHVMSCLKEINLNKTSDTSLLLKQINGDTSKIRWSWKYLKFYEITNQSVYNSRFQPFKQFYDRFYNGLQTFSLIPEEQYNIFDCDSLGITVFAFNSCFNNDLLNPTGLINPNCIASTYRAIKECSKKGRFIIGTWHHNVKGAPQESNYMDIRVLKNLLKNGITLAFHGHQHQLEKIDNFMNVSENEKITLVSAGTLCAGPKHLPTGINRQYNVFEIDNETYKAKLHSRKMMENIAFSLPIWEKDNISGCENGYIEIQLKQPIKPNLDLLLSEAIDFMGKREFLQAINILKPLYKEHKEAEKFMKECYIQTSNTAELIMLIGDPMNEQDVIILLQILFQERNKQKLEHLLNLEYVKSLDSPIVNELKNKCNAIL
jgi:hypothetical protein